MTVDRLDPPGLLKIPEMANVTVATGTRIVHVSGQTAVDVEGKVVGETHLEQSRLALKNVKTALEAGGATLADVAKFTIYIVDYSWDALQSVMTASKEVFGEANPITANTLLGVSSLWLPGLLVEVEAIAVI